MEKNQIESIFAATTPKRIRDDDTISPESLQKTKERVIRMASTSDEQFKQIIDSLNEINASQKSMEANISQMMKENAEFKQSICEIDQRVKEVEKKIEKINMIDEESSNEMKSKLLALEAQNNILHQKQLNCNVTIHNLPKHVKEGSENVKKVMQNIIDDLRLNIQPTDYDAYAIETKKKDLAMINVRFESLKMKKMFTEKVRAYKRDKNESHLLVEKIIEIPEDHPLNGKKITVTNHLTAYNFMLLQYARKFVPSHFLYAFDNDDGIIKVKIGQSFEKITSTVEVDKLVSKVEADKNKKKTKNNIPKSTRVTRLSVSSVAMDQD